LLGVQPEFQVAPRGPAGLLPKRGREGGDFGMVGHIFLIHWLLHDKEY
jgi:hypothetical protein